MKLIEESQELLSIPFLKWVGSKQWLKKQINYLISKIVINTYHEPFLGSGAVFFFNNFKTAYLNDLNKELVITFKVVKEW
jgi:DNA adenine methylase